MKFWKRRFNHNQAHVKDMAISLTHHMYLGSRSLENINSGMAGPAKCLGGQLARSNNCRGGQPGFLAWNGFSQSWDWMDSENTKFYFTITANQRKVLHLSISGKLIWLIVALYFILGFPQSNALYKICLNCLIYMYF